MLEKFTWCDNKALTAVFQSLAPLPLVEGMSRNGSMGRCESFVKLLLEAR